MSKNGQLFFLVPSSVVVMKQQTTTDRDADGEENGIGTTASTPVDGT